MAWLWLEDISGTVCGLLLRKAAGKLSDRLRVSQGLMAGTSTRLCPTSSSDLTACDAGRGQILEPHVVGRLF